MSTGKYKISGRALTPPPPTGVIELEISRWAAGGRGLGRVDGKVWMVAGAVPGDAIVARAMKDHGRFVEGELVRIVRPSPMRREPPCPLQPACGGCPMMPVDEAAQADAKRAMARDALERIGGLGAVTVLPVVSTPPSLGYRSKIELTFGEGILGYHRGVGHGLIDVPACAIADPRMTSVLATARAFFLHGAGAGDPALDDRGEALRLVIRASSSTEELLVAFRGPDRPFASLPEYAELAMAEEPNLVGVVRIVGAPGRRGGARAWAVRGRDWIEERVLGCRFAVPATTFLQVHARASEALARHVLEGIGRPVHVVELYGGIGALSMAISRGGASAIVVEADPDAVRCGREAAERAGVRGVRFVCGDVGRFLAQPGAFPRPELVIADPPRTGFGRDVARRLRALGAPRIVVVSCDPATLARDLKDLVGGGYVVERVVPFELFPQTAHIETVAWLTLGRDRASGDRGP
jgi:23S rRNA (uracil1939-C5)-methyltransferase